MEPTSGRFGDKTGGWWLVSASQRHSDTRNFDLNGINGAVSVGLCNDSFLISDLKIAGDC